MNTTRDKVIENYNWTAYMKLKGQTGAQKEREILDEFAGFARSLRGEGVDYNIIVLVEGKAPCELKSDLKARENNPSPTNEEAGA